MPKSVEFHASPRPTLGVEWEVALIDPETGNLVARADELVKRLDEKYDDHRVVREFLANTVEMVTGVCDSVPQAIADLRESLNQVDTVASEMGLGLYSAGTHPFAHWGDQELSDKENYRRIVERTQWWGRQMLIWGIHVHVGISDKERVWPIINAMLLLYPHILALSASSPAWEGIDTGYASNRTLLYQQLPTAGLPFQMKDWDEWESYTEDQLRSGVITEADAMHLDIRPAGKWGTIEVRFADATSNLRELGALVAFMHCAIVYFDKCYERGEELPTLQPWHVKENKWRAARYGLDAIVIVDRETNERDVKEDIRDWVTKFEPVAEELGCTSELADVLHILSAGGGYQRQRAAAQRAGAAHEPGARLAEKEERYTGYGFASHESWKAAVTLVQEELKRYK